MSLSKEYVSESESEGEEVVFQPPRGYQKVKSFKSLPNLDNKEVWLIKAPKGFNFGSLKKLPISFNPLESSIPFELESKSFQVQEDLTNINIKDEKTSKYNLITPKTSKTLNFNGKLKIDRFYNIRESVKLPTIDYARVTKKRKNVQVVKGLAPQHFATGYGRTELDVTSDVDEDQDGDVIVDDEVVKSKKEKKQKKKEKKEKKEKK